MDNIISDKSSNINTLQHSTREAINNKNTQKNYLAKNTENTDTLQCTQLKDYNVRKLEDNSKESSNTSILSIIKTILCIIFFPVTIVIYFLKALINLINNRVDNTPNSALSNKDHIDLTNNRVDNTPNYALANQDYIHKSKIHTEKYKNKHISDTPISNQQNIETGDSTHQVNANKSEEKTQELQIDTYKEEKEIQRLKISTDEREKKMQECFHKIILDVDETEKEIHAQRNKIMNGSKATQVTTEVDNHNPSQLAEEAYGTMFDNNKARLKNIPETQDKSKTCIERLHNVSKLFIEDIKEELGELTEEEQEILKAILSLPPLRFIHYSEYNLVSKGILQILSKDKLKKNKPDGKYVYDNKDNLTANTDFVCFNTSFTGSSVEQPELIFRPFGPSNVPQNSYIIPEKFSEFGYITLLDHNNNHLNSHSPEPIKFDENIDDLCELIRNTALKNMASTRYKTKPIFTLKDTRLGMALYIIKIMRNIDKLIEEESDKDKLLQQRKILIKFLLSDDPNIRNSTLNSILNLEYHLPGMVIAKPGEYAKHERKKA